MVVAVGGGREAAFLRAAGVIRVGGGCDGIEVAPSIDAVTLSPAMRGACSVRRSRQCRCDSIELVVREILRARRVEIVGNAVDVARVVAAGIKKIVGSVDGVATRGRGLEFIGLQAIVIGACKVQSCESRSLANRERVESALRRVADSSCEAACGNRLEIGGVGDAVRAIGGGLGAIGGVISVIDDAVRRIDDLGQVASKIEVISGRLHDAVRGALIGVDAALVDGINLVGPGFRASSVGPASSLPDVLARGNSEAIGFVVGCRDSGIAVGVVANSFAVERVKLPTNANAPGVGFGNKQAGKRVRTGAVCI